MKRISETFQSFFVREVLRSRWPQNSALGSPRPESEPPFAEGSDFSFQICTAAVRRGNWLQDGL